MSNPCGENAHRLNERVILRKGRRRYVTVLLAAATAGAAPVVFAATDTWTLSGSGLWSTSGDWSGGLPVSTSDVVVTTPAASQNITVTFDSTVAASNTNVNSLTIDTTQIGSTVSFLQTGKSLGTTADEIVGSSGRATFTLNGGTNNIGARLYLGNLLGSSGTYTLSAGTINNSGGEEIGYNGAGVFNQAGGVNNANFVAVGNFLQTGASGTYNLSNGATLTVTNNESVGDSGVGNFNQTGGVQNVNGTLGLLVGFQNSASGTYTLSGGTLNVSTNNTGGSEYVGYANTAVGVFNQSGGINNAHALTVGNGSANAGVYSLSNGATLNVTAAETIGGLGNGTFNQTGGVHTVGGFGTPGLIVGSAGASVGTFVLSGGTLNVGTNVQGTFVPLEYVGYGGNAVGVFNHSAGANNALGLVLANSSGNFGTYNLSNGATLNLSGDEFVGAAGAGVFNQTGGTHNVNGTNGLYVGYANSASGTFSLSGGTLLGGGFDVSDRQGNEWIGYTNTASGVFNQSGGYNTTYGNVILGNSAGNVGTYNMSNSASALSPSGNEIVGNSGTGIFNQTGGVNTPQEIDVGENAGSTGTYLLSGNGTVSVSVIEIIGVYGAAAFIQSGGINNTPTLILGAAGGGAGTYTLSGSGVLITAGDELIGYGDRPALFNQSGGSNSATNIDLGVFAPGTYNLSNGASLTVTGNENVGTNSAGIFAQSGGTNTVSTLVISNPSAGSGTYQLLGGALLAGTVNLNSRGSFLSQGGTLVAGTFNQIGGAYSGPLLVSGTGVANYLMQGGVLTSTNLTVAAGGTFSYSGGSLTGSTINQTGGSAMTANLILGGATNATAYNLQGGALNSTSITLVSGGTFSMTGGVLNATVFSQNGGLVSGTLQNTGTFSYAAGTFSGRLVNQGTANLGAAFTAGNGIENDSTINIPSTTAVTANGAGFDNEGALNLSGGTLTGAGPIINNALLTGYGTIGGGAGFTNNAIVTQGAGTLVLSNTGPNVNNADIALAPGRQLLLNATLSNSGSIELSGATVSGTATLSNGTGGSITGPGNIGATLANSGSIIPQNGVLTIGKIFTNNGVIQLNGVTATLAGAGIVNASTLQGMGTVAAPVTNNATIESVGGTLVFSGPLTNPAGGLLRSATGTKLLINSGLATSAGLINLTGGTFDNGGKPLVNTGQITGYGTFAAGSLTNAAGATINLAGGPATFNGPLVNAAGGTVHVNFTAAIFTAAVTNNGTFRVDNGSVTFAAGFVNNGLYISDPSDNNFNDLNLTQDGALVGGAGDRFTLTGSLHSSSTQSQTWNTRGATLAFSAGSSSAHELAVSGSDSGGYADNFAWGTLELGPGQTLLLDDATGSGNAALYTSVLQLDGAPGTGLAAFIASHIQSADASDSVSVYYDPTQAANAYLADQTYALGNGGELAPANPASVPEPATTSLLILVTAGTIGRRRRKRRP